jgi:hypothetical protein
MAIKFNIEPYYDDFNVAGDDGLTPKEKYNRILFRPGHAVQARELTQIQSMLQHQVSAVGRHLFEEGSMVIPGHASIETELDYVKLDSINETNLDNLIGKIFVGADTNLEAKVVAVAPSEGADPDTIYVKYQNSGDLDEKVFDDGETISVGSYTGVVSASGTGFGSVAFIEEGIYFIENHFVVVKADQLILDKYDTDPSYDIGLEVTESIATSAEDVSLNDNANGTPNYAAPGAHRYKISTSLVKQANEASTIEKFLLLIRVVNGEIIKKVRATEYSVLEETLARRTYDESGDYTVRPFVGTMYEHTTINNPGDDAKLSLALESGKAYVKGFELETLSTSYVDINKARSTELFEAASVPMLIGNYIEVNSVEGIPDVSTFGKMSLYDATGGTGTIIGYARARSFVKDGSIYRLYLFDIQMNANEPFQDVRSVKLAGTPEFVADVVLTNSQAIIKEPNRNSMVFKLPFTRVKTCDSQGDDVADDFNYVYFLNRDVGSSVVAAGEAVFNTVGANELFEPFDDENWILTIATGANNGDIVTLTSGNITVSGDSQTVTISGLSSYNGETVRLIAGVKRSINHKTKSLTSGGADNVDLYPINSPTMDWMQLGHADGYRLIAVYQSADLSTAATINDEDVTEYFDFDNGQRDNYYGICRVRVKPATAWRSSGRLLVKYEYFTHSGSGDFFTVDSYQGLEDSDGNALEYEDIPNFVSNSGEEIELRSAIDFRPRIDNSGGNFSGTGASTTVCPEPLTTFTTDVQYYLDRIDKVYLDKTGAFGTVQGVPAVNPSAPADPKDAMVLYHLYIPAYTLEPGEVQLNLIDNKRYTMRDIGKLEKRINSLEYYTSLSLLEKDAENRDIIDEATNTQRIKSGFVVDSFASHSLGNVVSNEFRASIDRGNRRLRAPFSEDNVRLLVNNALSSNYARNGDIITLPYTETALANQNLASNYINVNPYEVFSWEGNIQLSPTSDEWKDTTRRPDVIVNQDGVYDAMMSIIDATDAVGTQWNEWTTNWTGVEKTGTRPYASGRMRATVYDARNVGTASRTGIETFVSPETIQTDIGDRVVEINFAPFIRSRIIAFKATRLKPNTEVYAFFDGVNVSDYVRTETDAWADMLYSVNDNPVLNGKNTLTAHPLGSSTLVTDAKGEVRGSFFIPNNDATFFKTGNREFKLTDNTSNNDAFATTLATANYSAKGLIETKENVTISTRVPTLETREVSDSKTVKSGWRMEIVPGSVRWVDPLAQSFIIPLEGGAFITGIDLFFHTKDDNIPVTLQIREMENGIPTQRVVPFSEVTLDANDVSVVDLTTDLPDSTVVTQFNFESPVYLQDGTEYCFVVMANSNEYQLWYAGIGDNDHETGNRISKQPYAGVMFKSQNASTWTPDQNKDLKFKIKRAVFDTNVTSTIILENGEIQTRQLIKNPFATTDGSNIIRVTHKNHHMFENTNSIASYVTITGATDVNGIPAAEINGTHEVDNIEMDSYTITVTTNATGTGIDGGTTVEATENQLYNTFYANVQHFNLPGTNTGWGVKTSTGMSLGATSPTPYVTDANYTPIIVNQNVTMTKPAVIATADNEQSGKTFYLRGTLSSTKDNISPVIDLERCSVFTIANRIDNPVGTATIGYNLVDDYYPETDPTLGSAKAKYVTKNIKLADAADGIRVFMDINRPSQTTIEVYYRASDNEENLDGLNWIQATAQEPIQFDDAGFFNEAEFVIDPPGVFTVFALKIVMKSSNSSRVPQVKDLRIIALQP